MKNRIKCVLTIAGSDSGGGAGIQADLKTCTALGCYGASVITAVTSQNTLSVTSIHELPPREVEAQLHAVLDDIDVDAVKTGMMANTDTIASVVESLQQYPVTNIVVDPVMISKSGAALLPNDAVETLKIKLAPMASLITPNVPEAEILTGLEIRNHDDVRDALDALYQLGAPHVLLKGGHFDGDEATDYLFDGASVRVYSTRRIETRHTHGTGCTYSSAIACYLAMGCEMPEAVRLAKDYLTGAIEHSNEINIGKGTGPLNHFWRMNRNSIVPM